MASGFFQPNPSFRDFSGGIPARARRDFDRFSRTARAVSGGSREPGVAGFHRRRAGYEVSETRHRHTPGGGEFASKRDSMSH